MRALEWAFECSHPLWPVSLNMPPTKLKLHKITQYLEKELARGRMIGPLPLTGRLSMVVGVHRHVEWGVLSPHHLSEPPLATAEPQGRLGSPAWRRQFSTIFRRASPSPPSGPTGQQ